LREEGESRGDDADEEGGGGDALGERAMVGIGEPGAEPGGKAACGVRQTILLARLRQRHGTPPHAPLAGTACARVAKKR
jgi:hypothetical protein